MFREVGLNHIVLNKGKFLNYFYVCIYILLLCSIVSYDSFLPVNYYELLATQSQVIAIDHTGGSVPFSAQKHSRKAFISKKSE